MKRINFRHLFIASAIFILVSVLGLWSWTTLSSLFEGPQAQYRHVLAAAIALLIFRWSFTGGHYHRMHTGQGHRQLADSSCGHQGNDSQALVRS